MNQKQMTTTKQAKQKKKCDENKNHHKYDVLECSAVWTGYDTRVYCICAFSPYVHNHISCVVAIQLYGLHTNGLLLFLYRIRYERAANVACMSARRTQRKQTNTLIKNLP